MSVIELGDVSTSSAGPAPARPFHPRDLRRGLVAVIALLTVLGVTGSSRPEPRGLRTLWKIPATQEPFTVQGDTLYLQRSFTPQFPSTGLPGAEPRGPEDHRPTLEARAMADGKLRWKVPLEAAGGGSVDASVPGLVMVPQPEQQADGSNPTRSIIALDAATGRERWRHRGEPYGQIGADRTLLVEWGPRGGSILRLHMVRVADGATLWSYAPDEAAFVSTTTLIGGTPDEPAEILMVDRTGGVEVRGLADGKVVRTGKLPWLPADPGDDAYAYLMVFGDVLIAVTVENGAMNVSAHDVATLRPRWSQFTENTRLGGIFDCLGLICRGSSQIGMEAIDPHTGRPKWRSEGWDYGHRLSDTRMFVESHDNGGNGVLDIGTGRLVARLPAGMVVTDQQTDDLVLLGFTREPPIRMTVNVLQPDNTLRLAGALPPFGEQGCQMSGSRLVCLNRGDQGENPDPTMVLDDPAKQEIVVTDVG